MPDEDLSNEWQRLRERDYAEEGIPMIVSVETVGAAPPPAGEPGVAASFRAVSSDPASAGRGPARVLELLAAREWRQLA